MKSQKKKILNFVVTDQMEMWLLLEDLTSTTSLIKELPGERVCLYLLLHTTLMKEFYVKDIMMLTMLVMKILTLLM
jgi:hypothetical protein